MNRYRHLGAALLCVAVLAGVSVLGGCGSSASEPAVDADGASPAPSATAVEPAASAASPSGPAQVGDQLSAGPWSFSVSDVYVEPEAPGQIPPPAGKELMFVAVDLANTGDDTLQIEPKQFELTDAGGATVKTFARRQAYNALDMSPLEPDYGTTTAFIYAVDPGSTGYTLTFSPEVDGQAVPLAVTVR